MLDKVNDRIAENLEESGLWRRAASRWLDVMQSHTLTDVQRDWIRKKRNYCLACVPQISPPPKLDVAEILRAATKTQIRMGMHKPNGEAFRLKTKISDNVEYESRWASVDNLFSYSIPDDSFGEIHSIKFDATS